MANSSVKFPTFRRTFNNIKGIADKNTLDEVGELVVKAIQEETRKGRSLVTRRSLAPLRPSTIASRQRYRGPKGAGFNPRKSNLTLSGQMIDSLDYRTNVGTTTVRVEPFGQRRIVRSGEKRFSNKRVALFATDGSANRKPRPFIPVSRLPNRLLQQIREIFVKSAKRRFS